MRGNPVGKQSDINLAAELSWNERHIVERLLRSRKEELERIIGDAEHELHFVDDLLERTEAQEDK
jgi:hypothetical protein